MNGMWDKEYARTCCTFPLDRVAVHGVTDAIDLILDSASEVSSHRWHENFPTE